MGIDIHMYAEVRTNHWLSPQQEALVAPEVNRVYVQIRWPAIYAKEAGDFYTITMPKLLQKSRKLHVQPLDIRLVFGFDS